MKGKKGTNRIIEELSKVREIPFFNTLTHFKNYLSATIAQKALGFISIPILTRLLSSSEYGYINLFTSYVSIFVILFTLNTHSAVGRYYYENKPDFKQFFTTSMGLSLFFLFLFYVLLIFFREKISDSLNIPIKLLLLTIPASVNGIILILFIQVFQPQERSRVISVSLVIKAYATFGFAVLFISLLNQEKYYGMIVSQIIVGTILSIFFLIFLKDYFAFCLRIEHLKYIINYSLPLIPYALSGIILAQFDRIMINSYIGSDATGLYSLAYNIGMLMAVFDGAFNSAWSPKYYKYLNAKDYNSHDNDLRKIIRISLSFALFLILFSKEIVFILADEPYHVALPVVPIVVLGYVFFGLTTIYGRNIDYEKKTIWSSIAFLSAGILNIILNSIYIPNFGYVAGAYTTLVSYLFLFLFVWVISKFFLKTRSTPIKIIIKPLIIFLIFFGIRYFMTIFLDIPLYLSIILKIILISVFMFTVFGKYILNTKFSNS